MWKKVLGEFAQRNYQSFRNSLNLPYYYGASASAERKKCYFSIFSSKRQIMDPNSEYKEPAKFIDLRSDTFTTPSPAMRRAMFEAEVGDDVVGEDPTVNALQERVAKLLKKEAAIFLSSGTMSNLIAILGHCYSRGDKVLVGDQSHIRLHEDDGASVFGVPIHTIPNSADGTFDLDLMEEKMKDRFIALVCIENTFNGSVLPLSFLSEISSRLSRRNIPLHIDGARLFNAAAYCKVPVCHLVENCSSVSVCFSKGLGAPAGSMLVGTREFIQRAHRLRHLLGGAMRQVGVLAAPADIAMDEGVEQLIEDHRRMSNIVTALAELKSTSVSLNSNLVHTNIALITIDENCGTAKDFIHRISKITKEEEAALGMSVGIKCYEMGSHIIRFVTYNGISDSDVDQVITKLQFVIGEMDKAKHFKRL